MLKKFIQYYKPHKRMFALDMLASLFVSVIAATYPIVTRLMLNDFIPNKRYSAIVVFGITLLLLYLIRMLLMFFVQYQGHMIGVKIQAQMRSDMFNHLETLPYGFYDNHETGKIMSRLTNDLMDISELAHHGPENIIISSISIILSFSYLCTINVPLTLIIFICVPALIIMAARLRITMRDAFKRSRQSIAEINATLENSISGIRTTKAFTNSETESIKFEKGNVKFVGARQKAYKAMGEFHSFTSFITDIFNVIVLIAGGLFLYNGKITFADYSAFIVSVNVFLSPVTTLINFMEQYQNGVTGFERFLEVMDELKMSTIFITHEQPENDSENATDITCVEGNIEFRNVSYGYNEDTDVLKNVSLKIGKGKTFALVGPSGGGKTTICHLIPHFYDAQKGEILIDGKEIHSITLKSLRKSIGIVQQDIYLFNSTIKENILYGNPDADFSEVIAAAKRANIHDYIMTLPEGYDTKIGERGVKLSGGQKQRLSIARVFLKNPPILILDEATSALDNTTEILIQQSLDELCKGRTTIVVAHRLSTVKNADEIAVIDNGEITEQGTHEELMKKGGMYACLYTQQFRE